MERVPFQAIPLRRPSFFRKLFRQPIEENALIEVNNLLATVPIDQITAPAISEIENRYNIDLLKTFGLNMQEFYAVYLQFSLAHNSSSNGFDTKLPHLQHLLRLDDTQVKLFHIKIGGNYFREAVKNVIRDGTYNKKDQQKLYTFANNIKLPIDLALDISREIREEYVGKQLQNIIASKRLSPNTKLHLQVLVKNLEVDILDDQRIRHQLTEFENYWQLENEPLPILSSDIDFPKNEICYFRCPGTHWYEDRSIGRGLYKSTLIQTGTLYLTNKQLVFIGSDKTSKIKMEKILRIIKQEHAIEVIKETGRNPTLEVGEAVEKLSILMTRIMN